MGSPPAPPFPSAAGYQPQWLLPSFASLSSSNPSFITGSYLAYQDKSKTAGSLGGGLAVELRGLLLPTITYIRSHLLLQGAS